MARIDIITCPCCGAEYTAGELYVPEAFLGQPKQLEKEALTHRILFDGGNMMDTKEHYICDYCNTPFNIYAYVKFNTEEDRRHNFNKNYATSLKKNFLFLDED